MTTKRVLFLNISIMSKHEMNVFVPIIFYHSILFLFILFSSHLQKIQCCTPLTSHLFLKPSLWHQHFNISIRSKHEMNVFAPIIFCIIASYTFFFFSVTYKNSDVAPFQLLTFLYLLFNHPHSINILWLFLIDGHISIHCTQSTAAPTWLLDFLLLHLHRCVTHISFTELTP